MLVAGETSGDALAAELVREMHHVAAVRMPPHTSDLQPLRAGLQPRFFGAGGPEMARVGVELSFDLTAHAVVGLSDVIRKLFEFRCLLNRLATLALARQPDALICVDFSGFNRRLAHAVRRRVAPRGWFNNWHPRIVQYVSPQVWASRESRAGHMARDYDLLLTIIPFEQEWYAKRYPHFPVRYVGHPMIDRHRDVSAAPVKPVGPSPLVALLPGSRVSELHRHLPVIAAAFNEMRRKLPALSGTMVLANASLAAKARSFGIPQRVTARIGGLAETLQQADIAIASTGTVTMECALFGVPTVALYKTSWSTYQIGKRIVKVPYLAMPNLLAGRMVFPEFIQDAATPGRIASAGIELLENQELRGRVRTALSGIISSLGPPGASKRAAEFITELAEP